MFGKKNDGAEGLQVALEMCLHHEEVIKALNDMIAVQNDLLEHLAGAEKRSALFAAMAIGSLTGSMISSGALSRADAIEANRRMRAFMMGRENVLPSDASDLCEIALFVPE